MCMRELLMRKVVYTTGFRSADGSKAICNQRLRQKGGQDLPGQTDRSQMARGKAPRELPTLQRNDRGQVH